MRTSLLEDRTKKCTDAGADDAFMKRVPHTPTIKIIRQNKRSSLQDRSWDQAYETKHGNTRLNTKNDKLDDKLNYARGLKKLSHGQAHNFFIY